MIFDAAVTFTNSNGVRRTDTFHTIAECTNDAISGVTSRLTAYQKSKKANTSVNIIPCIADHRLYGKSLCGVAK